MLTRLLLSLSLVFGAIPAALAEGGPALITVSGAIDKPNRGPLDPLLDATVARFVESFERAHAFDLADLQALPQHAMTVSYADWSGASHSFEGPLMADVLAAAGATGTKAIVIGLDGYSGEFDVAVLEKAGFILALKMDGQPLAVGGLGPAWLMVSPDAEAAFSDGKPTMSGLVYAAFHIAVE